LFRNQTVSLGIEKNGGRLFRRPKLALSYSAEGKEGLGYIITFQVPLYKIFFIPITSLSIRYKYFVLAFAIHIASTE
jgi:hypothetical protein